MCHGIEFTYDELSTIMDSLYESKEGYERNAAKYLNRTNYPEFGGKYYYENFYKPTQAKFDEIRNKCMEIRTIMREEQKKSKGAK